MHRAQDVRGMVGSRNASIPCLVLYEAASGCSEATLQKSPSAVRSMAAAGGIRLTECNTAMKALKRKSAHRVFQEVPELKLDARTNHLWQRGYNWKFVPPQAEAAVRRYIQTQMDRLEKFAR